MLFSSGCHPEQFSRDTAPPSKMTRISQSTSNGNKRRTLAALVVRTFSRNTAADHQQIETPQSKRDLVPRTPFPSTIIPVPSSDPSMAEDIEHEQNSPTSPTSPTSPISTCAAQDSCNGDRHSKDLALRLRRLSSPRWFSGRYPPAHEQTRTIRPVTPYPSITSRTSNATKPLPELPPVHAVEQSTASQQLADPFTDFTHDTTAALKSISTRTSPAADTTATPPTTFPTNTKPSLHRALSASTLSSTTSSYISSLELNYQMYHKCHAHPHLDLHLRPFRLKLNRRNTCTCRLANRARRREEQGSTRDTQRIPIEPSISAPTIPRRWTDPRRGPCWWQRKQRRQWMAEQAWTRVVLDEWDSEEEMYCGRVVLRKWGDVLKDHEHEHELEQMQKADLACTLDAEEGTACEQECELDSRFYEDSQHYGADKRATNWAAKNCEWKEKTRVKHMQKQKHVQEQKQKQKQKSSKKPRVGWFKQLVYAAGALPVHVRPFTLQR